MKRPSVLSVVGTRISLLAVVLVGMTVVGWAGAPEREGLPRWVPDTPTSSSGWPVGNFACDSNPWEQYDYPEAAGPRSTIYPKSPPAIFGRSYCMEVPHCGLDWITDFDGSFWEVLRWEPEVRSNLEVGEGVGSVRLTGLDEAVFIEWRHGRVRGRLHTAVPDYDWEWGDRVSLRRLEGPIVIADCA